MKRDASNAISVIAAIMVGVGALLSSGFNYMATLWNISSVPRVLILPDPTGWGLLPGGQPLRFLGPLLAFVLLVGLTWLFVRLIVRASATGRAAAVFFGTWGALIIAAWIAGVARAPILIGVLGIPAEQTDLLMTQFYQISTAGIGWGVNWGWMVALVAALIHRSSAQPAAADRAYAAPYAPAAPAGHPSAQAWGGPQTAFPPAQAPFDQQPQQPPQQHG